MRCKRGYAQTPLQALPCNIDSASAHPETPYSTSWEEQREIEKLRPVDFPKGSPRIFVARFGSRSRANAWSIRFGFVITQQPVEIFQGHERVLINGVPMVKVADDEGIDSLEFKKQARQKTQAVHHPHGGQKRRKFVPGFF